MVNEVLFKALTFYLMSCMWVLKAPSGPRAIALYSNLSGPRKLLWTPGVYNIYVHSKNAN